MPVKLPLITLILLISFASVNAVLFTPALPDIVTYFTLDAAAGQHTITWFLVGYALGQLVYGPVANRYGRKPALYGGIGLQVFSSLLCALSYTSHRFEWLVLGRFLLALGSGVGLKMTFTLVSECYEQQEASKITSYLMTAFAITPGLAVALGGLLNHQFGWVSCFYAGAIYGLLLLGLVVRLPETLKEKNRNALKLAYLVKGYGAQFKSKAVLVGGLLMGCATTFVYSFAAIAPFVVINLYGLSSAAYGLANIIPSVGLLVGSLLCAQLTKKQALSSLLKQGVAVTLLGVVVMGLFALFKLDPIVAIFVPMAIIYFGLSFIMAIASALTMAQAVDKAYASAVMSFLNMGLATVVVLSLGFFRISTMLLPGLYLVICAGMVALVLGLRASAA